VSSCGHPLRLVLGLVERQARQHSQVYLEVLVLHLQAQLVALMQRLPSI